MQWIRQQLFTFGYWLGDKTNVYQDRAHDPTAKWWDISVSFEGTQKEAEELLDHMVDLACGNPKCGEFGEHCKRDWAGSSGLLVRGLRLLEDAEAIEDTQGSNTNPTVGSFDYTTNATR